MIWDSTLSAWSQSWWLNRMSNLPFYIWHMMAVTMHFCWRCCRRLVKSGLLLAVSGSDTWSLGIPTLHMFTKTFNIGRKALLTVITKCKYYEITEQVRPCREDIVCLLACHDVCQAHIFHHFFVFFGFWWIRPTITSVCWFQSTRTENKGRNVCRKMVIMLWKTEIRTKVI